MREAACLSRSFLATRMLDMAKCCVFIDGENLRHGIVDLFPDEFARSDYLPKEARWADLFDDMVSQACPQGNGERLRSYWYAVQHLDIFPRSFPDTEQKLVDFLRSRSPFKNELNGMAGSKQKTRCTEIVNQTQKTIGTMKRRFDGWTTVQNAIATKHRSIEFRRAGAIRFNGFENKLGQEKAVDVKLATDLIMLRDNYDVAVIVSGDQDYVPAVQVVKDAGKQVVNVAFERKDGKLLPGGAWRLNALTDDCIRMTHKDLAKFLGLHKTPRK